MAHRPVHRSQTKRTLGPGTAKCDALSDALKTPTRRQQRKIKKAADGAVRVDQCELESQRKKGLDDEALTEYGKRNELGLFLCGSALLRQFGVSINKNNYTLHGFPLQLKLRLEKRVLKVAAGDQHILMLMADGTLQSFGSNDDGALGRETVGHVWGIDEAKTAEQIQSKLVDVTLPRNAVPKDVRCTESASFFWTEDGRIFGWGLFRRIDRSPLGFLTNNRIQKLPVCIYKPTSTKKQASKLATGRNHVLALLNDGSVLSFGDGEFGQIGRVYPEDDTFFEMLSPSVISALKSWTIVDVFCGEWTSFFKTASGTILACGMNYSGNLGIKSARSLTTMACPSVESECMRRDLLIEPQKMESINSLDVEMIAAGKYHTLILTSIGDVYSLGSFKSGTFESPGSEDEDEDEDARHLPRKIDALEGHPIESIAAKEDCSFCIDKDGRRWRFGWEHVHLVHVEVKTKRSRDATSLLQMDHALFGDYLPMPSQLELKATLTELGLTEKKVRDHLNVVGSRDESNGNGGSKKSYRSFPYLNKKRTNFGHVKFISLYAHFRNSAAFSIRALGQFFGHPDSLDFEDFAERFVNEKQIDSFLSGSGLHEPLGHQALAFVEPREPDNSDPSS